MSFQEPRLANDSSLGEIRTAGPDDASWNMYNDM
jgi:hypothetical protein